MSPVRPLSRRPPRRALSGHTNYRKRLKLVKSGKPRLVVRRSNKYLTVQLVESRRGGDYTAVTVTTKMLSKYGWQGGGKNIPAAYLAGLLAGKKATSKGYGEAIVDLGMHAPHPGSRLFAAVRGALDAGLKITSDKEMLPSEDRIAGKHVSDYYNASKESGESFVFSALPPAILENLPQHVEEVKQKIITNSSV
ncbi:MAG: 50S ribosomal protein L18 [Nitrososphaerota archaeon]